MPSIGSNTELAHLRGLMAFLVDSYGLGEESYCCIFDSTQELLQGSHSKKTTAGIKTKLNDRAWLSTRDGHLTTWAIPPKNTPPRWHPLHRGRTFNQNLSGSGSVIAWTRIRCRQRTTMLSDCLP